MHSFTLLLALFLLEIGDSGTESRDGGRGMGISPRTQTPDPLVSPAATGILLSFLL
jgi:hypothetical protein